MLKIINPCADEATDEARTSWSSHPLKPVTYTQPFNPWAFGGLFSDSDYSIVFTDIFWFLSWESLFFPER